MNLAYKHVTSKYIAITGSRYESESSSQCVSSRLAVVYTTPSYTWLSRSTHWTLTSMDLLYGPPVSSYLRCALSRYLFTG